MCGLHLRHFVRERGRSYRQIGRCISAHHMQASDVLRRHTQYQSGARIFRADFDGDDALLWPDRNGG